jgi:nucleotide-binding universal stress UspA family protein
MLDAKNILVPTDFSPYADKALDLAVDIAKHNNAKIHLLHVIESVQQCAADYCLTEEVVRGIRKQSRSVTDEKLEKETNKFKKDGVQIINEVSEGIAYEEILKQQKARKADLIVMSSHGKSGLKKHLIGSVADRVMKGASCNVVLVKS